MKFFAVFFTILSFLAYSDAWRRYYPKHDCRDCYGRYQREGIRYFDGCNWCVCSWTGVPQCTYRMCRFNRCFKPFKRHY